LRSVRLAISGTLSAGLAMVDIETPWSSDNVSLKQCVSDFAVFRAISNASLILSPQIPPSGPHTMDCI
jgi:hypothetical protein